MDLLQIEPHDPPMSTPLMTLKIIVGNKYSIVDLLNPIPDSCFYNVIYLHHNVSRKFLKLVLILNFKDFSHKLFIPLFFGILNLLLLSSLQL